MNNPIERLANRNPRVAGLLQTMLASESAKTADSIEYLNKFENIRETLSDLGIVLDIEPTAHKELAPALIDAILILADTNRRLKLARANDDEVEIEYLDLNTTDATLSRRIDDIISGYEELHFENPNDLLTDYNSMEVFLQLPRLNRLILATKLCRIAQDKSFTPSSVWVTLLDKNGL